MQRLIVLLTLVILGIATPALAQEATSTVTFDWKTIASTLLNSVLVMGLVQLLSMYLPALKERYPMVIPILATIIGPLVGALQALILAKLGIQVDFSPVLALLAGGAAVTMHQIGKQTQETKKLVMMRRASK